MKILVTGASGFTGRHFMSRASAAGHEVIALNVNLLEKVLLKQALKEATPDAIVHLAAISFVGHAETSAFYEVNVIGTLNLLEAIASLPNPPRRVLLSSTANVYGNTESSPIAETQSPAPVNHYGVSKLAMEYLAKTFLDRIPLFFTRPFNYTGVGQGDNFIIPKLVNHFAREKTTVEVGNLGVEREFNDVRFVCEAYLRLLDKAAPGDVFNICSGQPIKLQTVIELLARLTGHQLEVKVNPAFVRPNEIIRLYGDDSKLRNLTGNIIIPSLSETLDWMLSDYRANSSDVANSSS